MNIVKIFILNEITGYDAQSILHFAFAILNYGFLRKYLNYKIDKIEDFPNRN